MASTAPGTALQISEDAGAALITRGVCRYLDALDYACLTEFTLRNNRRADVMALGPGGDLVIVEVKSSLADYRADRKWPEYLEFCERFFFAVGPSFPLDVLPKATGLLVADGYDAVERRPSPTAALAPARRKAMTLKFARLAAQRLQSLIDPTEGRTNWA